jgi:hypothetical protein
MNQTVRFVKTCGKFDISAIIYDFFVLKNVRFQRSNSLHEPFLSRLWVHHLFKVLGFSSITHYTNPSSAVLEYTTCLGLGFRVH